MSADKPARKAKVTLKEIARQAGVSQSSVSLALRNRPGIPPETRDRVKAVAETLGYRPDARLVELMTQIRAGANTRAPCNIGWIDTWGPQEWKKPWHIGYWQGAKDAAQRLGYELSQIPLRGPGAPDARVLARMLRARNIRGLIVPLHLEGTALDELNLSDFSVVLIGNGCKALRFDRVVPDMVGGMRLALETLADLGYRRPGIWTTSFISRTAGRTDLAAFTWFQQRLFPSPTPPPLIEESAEEHLVPWIEKHQPDVIVVTSNRIPAILKKAGIRVPQDIGVVHSNWAEDVADWAGIHYSHSHIGCCAVELLVAQLQQGVTGPRELARTIAIEGKWTDGKTVRRQMPKK